MEGLLTPAHLLVISSIFVAMGFVGYAVIHFVKKYW
jgi:hypothetical protein